MCWFSNRERWICLDCGGWIELPSGQLNRAVEDWHPPGSPEARERDRLAAEINPFIVLHRAHGKDPGVVLRRVRPHQLRFWLVDPERREELGVTGLER